MNNHLEPHEIFCILMNEKVKPSRSAEANKQRQNNYSLANKVEGVIRAAMRGTGFWGNDALDASEVYNLLATNADLDSRINIETQHGEKKTHHNGGLGPTTYQDISVNVYLLDVGDGYGVYFFNEPRYGNARVRACRDGEHIDLT